MIELLAELVAVPSVTGEESEIRDLLADWLARMGLDVDAFDADLDAIRSDEAYPGSEVERSVLPVVLGRLNADADGTHVLLLGHVDVVPAGNPDTWTSPAFVPRMEGDAMYGRGTCDMKGGVAAILEALARLIENGHDGPVTVAFVPSEEDGGSGTLAAIRRGIEADVALIPEPTGLEIVTAHAGAITFRLDVPGRAAHASTRREGVSALEMLDVIRTALAADETRRNADPEDPRMGALGLPYPTIIGEVHGGVWASSVIDRLTITGRYGVKLGQDSSGAEADLRSCLEAAWRSHDFLSLHPLELDIYGARFDSCAIAEDHPHVRSVAKAFEAVTGDPATLVGAPYGADMRLLLNVASIPTVMFGPGDVRHAHAADEHVPLPEVETAAAVLTRWISDLD